MDTPQLMKRNSSNIFRQIKILRFFILIIPVIKFELSVDRKKRTRLTKIKQIKLMKLK